MERTLRCECGHVVRSSVEEDLVSRAQRHALQVHGMRFSAEQIIALARPVLDEPEIGDRR